VIELEWGRKLEDCTKQEVIVWNINEIEEEELKEIKMS
jgi:hypothetical protein